MTSILNSIPIRTGQRPRSTAAGPRGARLSQSGHSSLRTERHGLARSGGRRGNRQRVSFRDRRHLRRLTHGLEDMQRVETTVSGGCQCGRVRYRATAMLNNAHLCHCRMCQKAVGNIFAALVAAPKDAFTWTRGAPGVFLSSDHVERGFCAACGTPLFYNDLSASRINLTIGSLDRPQDFPPLGHTGIESRMAWFAALATAPDSGETAAGDHAGWAEAIASSNRQHPDRDTDAWPLKP